MRGPAIRPAATSCFMANACGPPHMLRNGRDAVGQVWKQAVFGEDMRMHVGQPGQEKPVRGVDHNHFVGESDVCGHPGPDDASVGHHHRLPRNDLASRNVNDVGADECRIAPDQPGLRVRAAAGEKGCPNQCQRERSA